MMNCESMKEEAVSPVVGVMLMLVVTIIIAALVSAFAGGMAGSEKATPSMVMEGVYSQSGGMTISHAGGDPIALSEVTFRTVPSELFGPDAGKFAYAFPKYILRQIDSSPAVNQTTGFYHKAAFVAGDVLFVNQTDCDDYATDGDLVGHSNTNRLELGKMNVNAQISWPSSDPTGPSSKEAYFRAYQFSNPTNIGKYFYLDLLDSTGNIITRAKITIEG